MTSLWPLYVIPIIPVCSGPTCSHPHRPHEQLLMAVVGVLWQHCCHWWCRPSCSRHCHCPCHAILALLLALAVTLLTRHCPALASLALVAISTHNPPYEQGLIGLGQVWPRSFLSPSPPHHPITLILPPCEQVLTVVVVVPLRRHCL